jgi:outer membrane lipoprotein-sorting protein
MVNRFLRTAPTRTLLATIAGLVAVIVGGTAIALAARGSGPVPKPKPLAAAIRDGLGASPVSGISADISFTNGLIGASELQGSDPLLQGGSGHVWISGTGRQFRLELYGDNGDPEIAVSHGSWWLYDPALNTVYEGKLSTGSSATHKSSRREALPSIAQIQTDLDRLARHLNVSGAIPSDVGGQPTYTVKVSPKRAGGLLGQLQLAWDAAKGVPLRFAVYRRGDSTPVVELAATSVAYGAIDSSVFSLTPPSGAHVVKVATSTGGGTMSETRHSGKAGKNHTEITGLKAVRRHLSFKLVAPSKLNGLSRQSVSLLDLGSHHGALLVYGQGLGGVVVLEEPASPSSTQKLNLSNGSGDHASGITLPTVTINGSTGQELDTALGTVLRFTSGGVTYTVLGSLRPAAVNAAARGL